jgi:3-hydroxyisobutyrate dehydrogenase
MTRVALVGIGTMGLPMGRNLLAAGHEVIGCDVDPGRASLLGVPFAATPGEAARGAELVILSLPSVAIVEEAVVGPRGVCEGVEPGAVVVDMSTSPPALARRLAERLAASGAVFLDAPVSGGPMGAEDASLTIMVGGAPEVFERARPVFEALGRTVVHVGTHGAGQAAKLCNNLVAGATMAALAECCAVARREGIDPKLLYGILSTSTGDSRVLRNRFPLAGAEDKHPSNRGFESLFAVDLIAKDLELAVELAREHGVEPNQTEQALAAYRAAQAAGLGSLDYSAVYRSIDGDGNG